SWGYLSSLQFIDQLQQINRFVEVPTEDCAFSDLLWSDPLQYEVYDEKYENGDINDDWFDVNYLPNESRECSYYYGYNAVRSFLMNNDLRAIIRAHECVDGVQQHDFESEDRIPIMFTVFSSAGYNGNNKAGAMLIKDEGMTVKLYEYFNPVFKQPFCFNAFDYSLGEFFSQLQSEYSKMMLYAFDPQEEDEEEYEPAIPTKEDELEKLDSMLKSLDTDLSIKLADASSTTDTESSLKNENITRENAEQLSSGLLQSRLDGNGTETQKVETDNCNTLQSQKEEPQKHQNNKGSAQPMPTRPSTNKTTPQYGFKSRRAMLSMSQGEDVSSMPSTSIILGTNQNKRFLSLSGGERKKSTLKSRFEKFYDSVPPTLAQLREYWNSSLKESQSIKNTPLESEKCSLNDSGNSILIN
ncbi:calcineurin catalytic subunit A, putative, partial [Entamoeba invadens IP1]|uniref:calcineurin catalytic subunit A, putative n=1 Tax=Entamoeba invadens IP1 TaxID=370355 RepID=UPI0002C3DDC6